MKLSTRSEIKMPQNTFSMQRKLLILLIYHHQFWCHAAGTTITDTSATARLLAIKNAERSTTTPRIAAELEMGVNTTKTETATPTPTTPPPPPQATTTTATEKAATSTPLVVVSSSEATLLTRNSFSTARQRTQRMQYFSALALKANKKSAQNSVNEIPFLPNSDRSSESDDNYEGAEGKTRIKIVGLETNCSRDMFEVRIHLNRGFHGLIYAKDFPYECRARGMAQKNITLRLPMSGKRLCGVRAEPRPNGSMEFSVRVMLQLEQKLRQSSDILRTVRCKIPLNAMGMTVASKEGNEQRKSNNYRNSRTRNFGRRRSKSKKPKQEQSNNEEQQMQQGTTVAPPTTTTTSTPRVRIWLELGDKDGSGVVEVGQETTLTVRSIVPGKMGVRVVECAALDGLDASQQLLDDRGCPVDEQVMPALHTTFKPAEEGWSKQNEDDLVEKIFTATFPAFKFPDRERLHVSCGVQLCKGPCPDINCRTSEPLVLSTEKHLARIEVFNSLAVIAPQIEVDRLRFERRYNMSVEEYPPYIRQLPTEGTLCLSVSKLAISFCILGIIFLFAVIVAIYSLIRSRRRSFHDANVLTSNASRIHRAEVCTSMFSSSSGDSTQTTRFGSKLLIPYYPAGTLPYGRVY